MPVKFESIARNLVISAGERCSYSRFKLCTFTPAKLRTVRTLKLSFKRSYHRDERHCLRITKEFKLKVLSKANQTTGVAGSQEHPLELS